MTAFPLIVLDASAALALLLAEEEGAAVAALVEETIRLNGQIFVPGIFWYELGNGMLNAERRNRMKREEVDAAERHFARLPFVTHPASLPAASSLPVERRPGGRAAPALRRSRQSSDGSG